MTTKQENTEALQKRFMQYQMLDQQMSKLKEQIEIFDQQIEEMEQSKVNMGEIATYPKGVDMFVPISGGVFVKATLKDASILGVNVGAHVVVEKTIPEAQKMLQQQIDEIAGVKKQVMGQMEKMREHATRLELELKKLVE